MATIKTSYSKAKITVQMPSKRNSVLVKCATRSKDVHIQKAKEEKRLKKQSALYGVYVEQEERDIERTIARLNAYIEAIQ